jgi:hypothetical protein
MTVDASTAGSRPTFLSRHGPLHPRRERRSDATLEFAERLFLQRGEFTDHVGRVIHQCATNELAEACRRKNTCPRCAGNEAARRGGSLGARLRAVPAHYTPMMLTLEIVERRAEEGIEQIRRAWPTLRRLRCMGSFLCGDGQIEVLPTGGQWNVHMHLACVCEVKRPPMGEIREQWVRLNGGQGRVHRRVIKRTVESMRTVGIYCHKRQLGRDWLKRDARGQYVRSNGQLVEFVKGVHGRSMRVSFGGWPEVRQNGGGAWDEASDGGQRRRRGELGGTGPSRSAGSGSSSPPSRLTHSLPTLTIGPKRTSNGCGGSSRSALDRVIEHHARALERLLFGERGAHAVA